MSALSYALGGLGAGWARGKTMLDYRKEQEPLGARPPADAPGGGFNNNSGYAQPPGGDYGANPQLMDLIDRTEGAGQWDTLFGHAQRPGGRFEGVDVSRMTIDELAEFSRPDGEYGQWVKSELERMGHDPRVATPMGRGQVVGTTLRSAAAELGLSGDTVYSPEVQQQIIDHLARKRMQGQSESAAIAGLRAEWEGLKNVPDDVLLPVVQQYMRTGEPMRSRPLGAV